MSTFLYRAVSAEATDDIFPGDSLGRATGYLSRSGAKDAGKRSGLRFEIVRSSPVVFTLPASVAKQRRIAELLDELAMLTG